MTKVQRMRNNPYSFTDPITLANVMHAYREGYADGLKDKMGWGKVLDYIGVDWESPIETQAILKLN